MTKLDTAKCYEKVYTDRKTGKSEHTYVGKFISQYTERSGDGSISYAEFKKEGKPITVVDGSWTGKVEFKEVECKGSEKLITKNNGKDKKKTGNGVNELYPYKNNNGKIEPTKKGIFSRLKNPLKNTKRAKQLRKIINEQEEEEEATYTRLELRAKEGRLSKEEEAIFYELQKERLQNGQKTAYVGGKKTRKRKTKKSRKTRK